MSERKKSKKKPLCASSTRHLGCLEKGPGGLLLPWSPCESASVIQTLWCYPFAASYNQSVRVTVDDEPSGSRGLEFHIMLQDPWSKQKKKKTYDRNNKVYDCGQIIQTWTRQLFLMWLLTRFLYYFIVFFLGISFHRSRLSRVTSVVIFGIHLCQVWSQRVAFDDLKFVIGTHDSKWSVQNGEFLVLL